MAKVTCFECKVKDEKTLMTQESNKKYYHHEKCHQVFLDQKELKRIENEKWSLLFEYIKSLHDIIIIPPRNITRLQELRNGFDIKEGKRIKRYKQGVPFDLMLEAYKLTEEKIEWFIRDVLKGGKAAEDINKCITLMLNNLNVAWAKEQHRLKQKAETENNNVVSLPVEESVVYRKRIETTTNDISDFL